MILFWLLLLNPKTSGTLIGNVLVQDEVLRLQGQVEMVLEIDNLLVVARPVGVFIYDWKAKRLSQELSHADRPLIAEWMTVVEDEVWIKDKLSGLTHRFSPKESWKHLALEPDLNGAASTPSGLILALDNLKQRPHALRLRSETTTDFGPAVAGLQENMQTVQVLTWAGKHFWHLDPFQSQLRLYPSHDKNPIIINVIGDMLPRMDTRTSDFLHEKTAFRAYMERHPPLSQVRKLGDRVVVGFIAHPKTGLKTVHVYHTSGKLIHAYLPLASNPMDQWTLLGGDDKVMWCKKKDAPQRLFRHTLVKKGW